MPCSYMKTLNKKCRYCKHLFGQKIGQRLYDFKVKIFCSSGCYHKFNSGKNHWYWKGGVKTRPDGYIRDSKSDRYIHRIVIEKYLGRKLKSSEHVHHIDGNPKNNKITNLQIMTNSEHRKLENKYAKRNKKGQYCTT